ncbi:MAG: hypothetical protein HYW86_04985 [Candidatus Roizmanbacteria bacterium]|nr:MAG: hypothetical protein HYW86_04985 [Candidatus Roizmanbacteria bacterium]
METKRVSLIDGTIEDVVFPEVDLKQLLKNHAAMVTAFLNVTKVSQPRISLVDGIIEEVEMDVILPTPFPKCVNIFKGGKK